MHSSIYTLKNNYLPSVLYTFLILGLVILLYPLWLPLGILSTFLFLVFIYKFFLKLALKISFYDNRIEVCYLQNFTKIINEKNLIKDIKVIEGTYTTGGGSYVQLKIIENSGKELVVNLGSNTHSQNFEFLLFLRCLLEQRVIVKLTAVEEKGVTFKKLKKVGLKGRLIKSKGIALTYSLILDSLAGVSENK